MSSGYSQQREEKNEKGGSIAGYDLSSGAKDGAIEKEKDVNKIQELS